MTVAEQPPVLDRDQLLEMFKHLDSVHDVELKMTVPGEQRKALRNLDIDTLQGKIREVTFFDTPGLDLYKAGVVVRGRRTQMRDDDTVVKLRPVVPETLPAEVLESENLKVEMDVTRGAFVVSASLKGTRPMGRVQEVLAGTRSLEKLLSGEQRDLFLRYAPSTIGLQDLVPLGPIFVVVVKLVPEGFNHKLTIEQWHYPGQVPLVELSTKAAPLDAVRVHHESFLFLQSKGFSAGGEQEPKTRKALEFFSKTDSAK